MIAGRVRIIQIRRIGVLLVITDGVMLRYRIRTEQRRIGFIYLRYRHHHTTEIVHRIRTGIAFPGNLRLLLPHHFTAGDRPNGGKQQVIAEQRIAASLRHTGKRRQVIHQHRLQEIFHIGAKLFRRSLLPALHHIHHTDDQRHHAGQREQQHNQPHRRGQLIPAAAHSGRGIPRRGNTGVFCRRLRQHCFGQFIRRRQCFRRPLLRRRIRFRSRLFRCERLLDLFPFAHRVVSSLSCRRAACLPIETPPFSGSVRCR